MRIRHESLKSITINTHHGEVELDEFGYVKNMRSYPKNGEALLEVPGLIDGDLFPVEGAPFEEEGEEEPAIEEVNTREGKVKEKIKPGISDEEYWREIQECIANGAELNIEGYVDITQLQKHLRTKGLTPISGARRKEITDKFSGKGAGE